MEILLHPKQAAHILGLSVRTLNGTDWLGRGRVTCAWGDLFATASKTLRILLP